MQYDPRSRIAPCLLALLVTCGAVVPYAHSQAVPASSTIKSTLMRTLSGGQDVVLKGQLLTAPVTLFGYGYRRADGASPTRVSLRLDDGTGTPVDIRAWQFDEPQAVVSYATDADEVLTSATAGPLTNAGWAATVSPVGLSPGDYTLSAIVMNFGSTDDVVVPISTAGQSGTTNRFTVAANVASTSMKEVSLVSVGAVSPMFATGALPSGVGRMTDAGKSQLTASVGLAAAAYGRYRLSGYPPLPSGDYVVMVPSANKYGRSGQAYAPLSFTYTRPVLSVGSFLATSLADKVAVALPSTTMIENTANGDPLAGSLGARIASGGGDTFQSVEVVYDATSRKYVVPALPPATSPSATPAATRLWLQHPDAPDLAVTSAAWDFSAAIKPGWDLARTVTADIEDVSFPVAFDSSKAGPCTGATSFIKSANKTNASTTVNAASINGSANMRNGSVLCALRWNTLIPTLSAENSAVLAGTLPLALNGTSLSYSLGILSRNPQGVFDFITLLDRVAPLSVIDQIAPTASFKQDQYLLATLRRGSADSLVTYAGAAKNAGTFFLQSALTPPFLAKIVSADSAAANETSATSWRGSVAMSVLTNQAVVGKTQRVSIEAWWPQTPMRKHTFDLDFTAIPGDPMTQILLATPTLTTAPTTFTGLFGMNLGKGVFEYAAPTYGTWAIKIQRQNRDGTWADVGEATSTAAVSSAGKMSITTPSPLPIGRWNFRATASITGDGSYAKTITSTNFQIDIHDGSVISGALTATPSVGPASAARPASVMVALTLDHPVRGRDIKSVQWQRSIDVGATWADVAGSNTSLRQYVDASGEYQYRAKISSLYIVDEFITQPVTVTLFTPPSISISGPKSLIAGQSSARYTVTTEASQGVVHSKWQVTRAGAPASEPATASGDGSYIDFTTSVTGEYGVKVSATQHDAPVGDARATVSETYWVYVAPPKPAAGRITPKPPISAYEVGVPYEFLATLPTLPSSLSGLAGLLRQAWVLPNRSAVAATTAAQSVTFQSGDTSRTVLLKTWFEGFERDANVVSFVAPTWTYSFPEFTIKSRLLNTIEAPALIDLSLEALGLLRVDSGTNLSVVWTVKQGAGTVVSSSGLNARVSLTAAGAQTIAVEITDARKEIRRASIQFTIEPAKEFIMAFGTAAMDDSTARAPLLVSIPPRVISLPRDDQLQSVAWTINGADAGTGPVQLGIGKQFTLKTAGINTIGGTFHTTKGRTVTITQDVNVTMGAAPVCTINRLSSKSNLLALEASCTVVNGRVTRYEWRNSDAPGAFAIAVSQRFTITLPTTLPTIYLKVCPDRGPCTDISYAVPGQ